MGIVKGRRLPAVRDIDLEPDVVVLYQGINDLQPASLDPFDPAYERHADLTRRALGFDLPALPWHRRSLLVEELRFLTARAPGVRAERWSRLTRALGRGGSSSRIIRRISSKPAFLIVSLSNGVAPVNSS